MKIARELNEFELLMNNHSNRMVTFEEKLLLSDNLNEKIEFDKFGNLYFPNKKYLQEIPLKINFPMFMFCLEGEIQIQLNLKDVTVKKNCIFSIIPGSIGRLNYISNNFRAASIFFSKSTFKTNLDIQPIIKPQHFIHNNPVIEIKSERINEFIDIYNTLYRVLLDKKFNYKIELIDAYLQVLKVYWEECKAQYVIDMPHVKPSRQKIIMDTFLNEIVLHFREERSVAFYAEKLCISPKYLSKVIKETSNRHPSDWIRELVILESKALLRTQQYSVQQISELLNFTSPSFFGRYFREAVGCTPRTYQTEIK